MYNKIFLRKHFLTRRKSVVITDSPPPLKGFVLCFFGIQESTKSRGVRKNDHPLKVDVSVINIDYYVYPPEIEVCKYLKINKLQRQPKRTCRQIWYFHADKSDTPNDFSCRQNWYLCRHIKFNVVDWCIIEHADKNDTFMPTNLILKSHNKKVYCDFIFEISSFNWRFSFSSWNTRCFNLSFSITNSS